MKRILLGMLILIATMTFNGCNSKDKMVYDEGDSFDFLSCVGDTSDVKLGIEYKKFYGVQTIWDIDVKKKGEIKFNFDSKVNNGKFKGVLISKDNEVNIIFEGNKKGENIIDVVEGKYRFKIIGNDANGEVNIELKLDKDMKSLKVKEN